MGAHRRQVNEGSRSNARGPTRKGQSRQNSQDANRLRRLDRAHKLDLLDDGHNSGSDRFDGQELASKARVVAITAGAGRRLVPGLGGLIMCDVARVRVAAMLGSRVVVEKMDGGRGQQIDCQRNPRQPPFRPRHEPVPNVKELPLI